MFCVIYSIYIYIPVYFRYFKPTLQNPFTSSPGRVFLMLLLSFGLSGRCCCFWMACISAMDTASPTRSSAHHNGTAPRDRQEPTPTTVALRLHLYHSGPEGEGDAPLTYPPGQYLAEELCIQAAKTCSEMSIML